MAQAKPKVLLVGPCPPPYGGLAVQLLEWRRYLLGLGAYDCELLNIGESRRTPRADAIAARGYLDFLRTVHRFARRGALIHLFTNGHNRKSWLCSLACALVGARYGRKTVLVFGSGLLPDYLGRCGWPDRLIVRGALRLGGRLICRHERMRHALVAAGADPGRVAIVSGFVGSEPAAAGPGPEPVEAFLATHSPLLGATAGLGREYGIPLLLEAMHVLRRRYPRIGLVLIGLDGRAGDGLDGLDRVREHVCLAGALPHEAVLGVMQRLTLFLRPTYCDGDSLSVREALALGTPVVASDTDFRPDGVIRFKRGDVADLLRAVERVLENRDDVRRPSQARSKPGGRDRVLALYREMTEADGCVSGGNP